jgi:glucokinase
MRFGMDFGGTNVKTGVFSDAGEMVASDHTPLPTFVEGDLLANLTEHARQVAAGYDLTAGGLAIKGLVDTGVGRVVDDIGAGSLLAGADLRTAFSEALGVPFAVENDARAYAWGEWRFGAGQGTEVMACVTLGTGIGCAVVAHGRPYTGADPLGGILGGHLCIDRNGPECPCGQRGCFELYCSATALAARVTDAHPELEGGDVLPDFFAAVQQGRQPHGTTLDGYLDDLALGIVNVVHAYGPECVILGGGVMGSADLILPGLTARVHDRAWTVPRRRVVLRAAERGDHAAAAGAAFHPSLD